MTPNAIFSLGGTLPSRPSTRAGKIVASDAAAVAVAVPSRKSRRVVFAGVFIKRFLPANDPRSTRNLDHTR